MVPRLTKEAVERQNWESFLNNSTIERSDVVFLRLLSDEEWTKTNIDITLLRCWENLLGTQYVTSLTTLLHREPSTVGLR